MKFKLLNQELFRNCINIISEFIEETSMRFSKDGIKMVSSNPYNGCLSILKIHSNNITDIEDDQELDLDINLVDFKDRLLKIKSDEELYLNLNENSIELIGVGDFTKKFSLPTYGKQAELKIPVMKYTSEIEINSQLFKEQVNNIDVDEIIISLSKEEIKLNGKENQKGFYNFAKIGKKLKIKKVPEEGVKSKYSSFNLNRIAEAAKISEMCTIKYSKDYPMQLIYDNTKKGIYLSFIIAPRVNNEP